MPSRISIALIHHPVLDREGKVITTAVTNMDLHDFGRLARTYGLDACYVVQPLELQGRLVRRLIAHWVSGAGAEYNRTRTQAFERVALARTFEEAVDLIVERTGERPRVIATSARPQPDAISYAKARDLIAGGGQWLVLFGTGWGLDPDFIARAADLTLEPLRPNSDYNHLSVRAAAAIIIDRLRGE